MIIPDGRARVDLLEATLPQLQCGKCGYPDCRSYATALASGETRPDRCTPGGPWTLRALGAYLPTPEVLDPLRPAHQSARAVIDPEHCIGCTRCLLPCPTRAIVGTRGYLHAVLPADCTGCGLCVAPCPVDCIELVPVLAPARPWPGGWGPENAAHARRRYEERGRPTTTPAPPEDRAHRRREIAAAVARSRQRRGLG